MKRGFRILAVVGLLSFAQSAHSGKTDEPVEVGREIFQIPSKMLLFKEQEVTPPDLPQELMEKIIVDLYRVTTTFETHTGAQFRYVALGEYADASLGEGRMDERVFVWYPPPLKNGNIFVKNMLGAEQECESYTLQNRNPERLVHVPKLERFIDLAADLGFGKEGGYQLSGFFSFLPGRPFWTSTGSRYGNMNFKVFKGGKGDKGDFDASKHFYFLCGVEAGEITIRRGEYFDSRDIY